MIDFTALQAHTKQLITELLASQGVNSLKTPRLIVALSGGADSVFLLHLLAQVVTTMPLTLIVAHLNHGWRGAADNADEQFCRNLAQQFNLMFVTARGNEIAINKRWNGSQEELGRHQRHTFLQNTAKDFDALGIALGHQEQDQQETFFIRLMRGASLEGLCCMDECENNIIRPLLLTSRTDIEQLLTANNQIWCTDSDNETSRFLRNRIRHELLPILHTIDMRFEHNFARTLHQLQQEQELIDELVNNTFAAIFDTTGKGDLTAFNKLHPMLQGHVFKKLLISNKMSFNLSKNFIDEALRFLNSPRAGTHQLNQSWALTKKSSLFFLRSHNNSS
jgi:tRNA(Ile)-lysidine synthase